MEPVNAVEPAAVTFAARLVVRVKQRNWSSVMILSRIKRVVTPGTRIPKPQSPRTYVVKGWGNSRGEEALVYQLPAKLGTKRRSEKRIRASAFEDAYKVLKSQGEITHGWFAQQYPDLEADGACNFTTLGGVLELLGEAEYAGPGVYRKRP